jgi:RimJ/RimL family protein N-acetyltransferase
MADFWLQTERLVLRSWREDDIEPFAAICADPVVMATLGPVMDLEATCALVARECAIEAELGHTFWVVERREDERLIGKCGIIRGRDGPIEGKPEIGWRLASDCWGQGYITETARGCTGWFFANREAESLWAITSIGNTRSRAVMKRLGMAHRAKLEFDHPRLAQESPLLRHVTYELPRAAWEAR